MSDCEAPEEHGKQSSGLEARGWEGHGQISAGHQAWEAAQGGGPGGQKFDHRHWGPGFPHSYENSSWKLPSSG